MPCAHAALPALSFTSSTRCSSHNLLHWHMEITPTPPCLLLLCPAALKPSATPSLQARLKPAQGSRWEITPSSPRPACARFRCLLDENLERKEGNGNSALLSVCVQQLQRQGRLAVLQAESPSHPPAVGSGSPALLPLDGQSTRALGMAPELKQGNSQGRKYHKALTPTVYKFQPNVCRVWVV